MPIEWNFEASWANEACNIDYNQFVADRISLSTAPASFVDYHAAAVAEEEEYNNQQRQIGKGTFSNYIDTFNSNNNEEEVERNNLNTALPELISPTNIVNMPLHIWYSFLPIEVILN